MDKKTAKDDQSKKRISRRYLHSGGKSENPFRTKGFIDSFNNAVNGIFFTITNERNFQVHIVAAMLILILSLFMNFSKIEMMVLSLTIGLVLFAELINTAVEQAVNLSCDHQYHPIAKVAKDVAAGAVLITAMNAIVVGYFLFYDRIVDSSQSVFNKLSNAPSHPTIIAVAVVLISTVLLKGFFSQGHGTPFQGGRISGHSSLAFCLATIGSILSGQGLVILIMYALALLVAESRIEGKIHSLSETIAGAVVGISVAILVFKIIV